MPTELYIVSLAIASVGAILGTLTFINQFLITFKPRIFLNNFVDIKYLKDSSITIESITLSFTFSNSKNTYGVIDDLAIGIYEWKQVSPSYNFLFPKSISIDNESFSPYSPIILCPKSHSRVFIKFENELFQRTVVSTFELYIDLLIKSQKSKKWKKEISSTFYPYNVKDEIEPKFTLIDFHVARQSLSNGKIRPKSKIKKGNIGVAKQRLQFIVFKIVKAPYYYFHDSIQSIMILLYLLLKNIACKAIFEKIALQDNGKRIMPNFANRDTDQCLRKCFTYVTKIIDKLVKRSKRADSILISNEKNSLTLTRNNYQLKIYYSGNSTIFAFSNSKFVSMSLEFTIHRNRVGLAYCVHNGHIISKYQIALICFDYFCLYSSMNTDRS